MRQNLGQHFLKDKKVLRTIAGAAELGDGDTVIEVGPGHGELTDELLRSKINDLKLIAIERDPELSDVLRKKYENTPFVEVIEGDVRKVLPDLIRERGFASGGYKLVGNIPYYLTGFLFRIVGALEEKPELCVFTIQKEVALRVAAKPPHMNLLAAAVQYWSDPRVVATIPKTAFSPAPEVDSAVITLALDRTIGTETQEEQTRYYTLIKTLFAQPRKTILNNLFTCGEWEKPGKSRVEELLNAIGVDPSLRPQDLDVVTIKKMRGIVYNKTDE